MQLDFIQLVSIQKLKCDVKTENQLYRLTELMHMVHQIVKTERNNLQHAYNSKP